MSSSQNHAAIGAFIVGAVIIAIAAVLFVSGSGWGQDKTRVVMVFDGSVKGLSVGAPIALRGVEIGQVTDIDLIFDTDTIDVIMLVKAEIQGENIQRRGSSDSDFTEEMIARGLRAQLNTQSLLTGLLYIQLDFHPNSQLILAETDLPYTQIPTIPTDLQRLSREFEAVNFAEVGDNLQIIAEGLSTFISSGAFQRLPQDLEATLATIATLSANLTRQLEISGPKLDRLMDTAAATVDSAQAEIPKISTAAIDTLSQLDRTLVNFDHTMTSLNHLLADDSSTRYELNKALQELALAGRAIRLLARMLEEQPQALLRGKSEDKP